MDEMYSDIILDHYRHPHNSGTLKYPAIRVTEYNPLCGDTINIDMLVGKDGTVKKVKFSGHGCAISQASASLLTDAIPGKQIKKIQKMSAKDILKLLRIPVSPGRMKCALLALSVVKKAAAQSTPIKKPVCTKKK